MKHFVVLIAIVAVSHVLNYAILDITGFSPTHTVSIILEVLLVILLIFPYIYINLFNPLRQEYVYRRQALVAVQHSEEALRTIVNSIHDAIFIADLDGTILQVNAKMLAMYRMQMDEVLGTSIFSNSHGPDNSNDLLTEFWKRASDGQVQLFEWNAYRPHDGTDFPAEVYLQKISLRGRDVILANVRDISLRKQYQTALAKSEKQFRAVFANAGVGIALVGADGVIVLANPALHRMLGHEHLAGMVTDTLTHPDDKEISAKLLLELLAGQRNVYQLEKRYLRKDDSVFWGRLTVTSVYDQKGALQNIVCIIEDISERKTAEDQLRLVANVVENTVEGVTITDTEATILSVNPAFTVITGYSAEEAIGQNPRILRSDRHEASFYKQMWQSLLETGQWQGEIWNRRKSGEAYPEWLTISSIQDANGITTNYVAVFHDITESKRNEAQIKYQAYHDALTGLPNRQLFNDRLELALAHAERSQLLVAVLFLDLDRFKTINDTLGHIVGDRLLQQVAKRLSSCVREDDTVARLGGDEFTVLLSEITHLEDAVTVAEKIVNLFQSPFIIDGHELFTTPSIGISLFPIDGTDSETLIKNADTALYRAKEQGRNNFQLYTAAMNARALERLETENALRRALERNEFLLYYQPRIDVLTGKARSAEALLRWQHPTRGLVAPGDFIPLAEETGLIVPIGAWVLQEVCRQQKTWLAAGLSPLRVAINLSARQFLRETLVTEVEQALGNAGVAPEYLELEITESAAMHHVEESLAMLQQLHDRRLYLAIDDFGTGYSSLGYLKKFPVHALKIDKSFIRDIPQSADDQAIAVAIIGLARTLGLQVIAEGVEDRAQLEFLQQYGCDEVQGYYFSMPLPADEFVRQYLSEREPVPVG